MSDADRTARPPGLWQRYRYVIETWLVFGVSAGVMIQLLIWARPFTDEVLPRWIASYTALAMAALGTGGQANGTLIHSSVGTVEIIRECTAVYPTALYLAAVLAFRCTWRKKLVGIFGGIVAIQFVNVVRIVTLIYVQKLYPSSFEFMHLVVWQSLVVFLTVLLWLLWSTAFPEPLPRDA